MRNVKRGFTLVEVLIVVVIIAILASLIVPRMLMQTDKAKAAEALQMVGGLKRAAERYYDFHGTFVLPSPSDKGISSAYGLMTAGDWSDLGLQGLEKSKDWQYSYTNADVNSYMLAVWNNEETNGIVFVGSEDAANPSYWDCTGVFKPMTADVPAWPTQSTQGCTI